MTRVVDDAGLSLRPAKASHTNLTRAMGNIGEIAEILAAGLVRVLTRKSSGKNSLAGGSSLDFSPTKSGDPTTCEGEAYG